MSNISKPPKIPTSPGVYFFLNGSKILYIGKAGNLKKRLASYWRSNTPSKAQQLIREATSLSLQETDSEIEALILEAKLIKEHRPKYNVLMRDDKNYFYVGVTKEEFPKIFITHQPNLRNKQLITDNRQQIKNLYIGPFTGGSTLKTTLRLLRRIFPYCTCTKPHKRPCLNAQIGRCLGFCCTITNNQQLITNNKRAYGNNIKNIIAVLRGKKQKLLAELKKIMREASRKQEYEKAAKLRNQIAGLEDVFAHRSVLELPRAKSNWPVLQQKLRILLEIKHPIERIEGYDISNISGTEATGSMVVFVNGKPNKKEYRTFRIKTVRGANDPAMVGEVIARRLRHPEWRSPDVMVIDGGKGQLTAGQTAVTNAHKSTTNRTNDVDWIREIRGSFVQIRVVALAKREEELYTEKKKIPIPLKTLDRDVLHLFQAVRDEAHRFAKKYHHKLRKKTFRN